MITTTSNGIRAAIYARVSTADQTCENQLLELHRYAAARGWTVADYVDQGVSGAKDRRPTEWVLGVSRIVERGALARDVEEER